MTNRRERIQPASLSATARTATSSASWPLAADEQIKQGLHTPPTQSPDGPVNPHRELVGDHCQARTDLAGGEFSSHGELAPLQLAVTAD